jgi:hypothetical protein
MVPVRDYIALWEYIASLITDESGNPSFTQVILVDDETHLQAKIAKINNKEIFLVVVSPSSDYQGTDEDNYGEMDNCILYVLQKVDLRNLDDEAQMTEREITQALMTRVKNVMKDMADDTDHENDHIRILRRLYKGKEHTDRERNYLGCNGYSLSFGLFTNTL